MKELDDLLKNMRSLMRLAIALAVIVTGAVLLRTGLISLPLVEDPPTEIVRVETAEDTSLYGSVDDASGLIIDRHFDVVKTQCGACHSTALVAQNRFTRDGWLELIRWMQAEQKLWDLGEQEAGILDYLAKNYAPKDMGRRPNLANIQWYTLDE
ncbi:MAG: hypothetical protein RIE58_12725 [Vicingaceae bacterium]